MEGGAGSRRVPPVCGRPAAKLLPSRHRAPFLHHRDPPPAHARSVCDVSPCSCRFEAFAYFSVSNDDLSISEDSGFSVSRS